MPTVAAGARVGPFAHLRPGAALGEDAHVGNFVELKNTTLGAGSKANHLAYLGDATIGAGVNVGAGTITCNYDGAAKHPTIIEDGVVRRQQLDAGRAGARSAKGAYVAAGSAITEDVPAGALGIGRGAAGEQGGVGRAEKSASKFPVRQWTVQSGSSKV